MSERRYRVNGELIRNARQVKGWSAAQLSEVVGITDQYLYRIERNEQVPAFPLVMLISDALDLPYFLLLDNNKPPITGKLTIGDFDFEVPGELIEPIIKLIRVYSDRN